MKPWWQAPAIIQQHNGVLVVREDLVDGGSKIRFLPHLVSGAREIVYGGPFCGGAPYALSVWGRKTGARISLFYAKRRDLHNRQKSAFRNGARIFQIPYGYMSNVQAKARAYAQAHGALFLPLGFDVKGASDPFVEFMRGVRAQVGLVDEVWCATGSGMLARCLGAAFPDAAVHGVVVGLKSRNQAQAFPPNVQLHDCRYAFAQPCRFPAPFPSCPNYDLKAWEMLLAKRNHRARTLFWNVLG